MSPRENYESSFPACVYSLSRAVYNCCVPRWMFRWQIARAYNSFVAEECTLIIVDKLFCSIVRRFSSKKCRRSQCQREKLSPCLLMSEHSWYAYSLMTMTHDDWSRTSVEMLYGNDCVLKPRIFDRLNQSRLFVFNKWSEKNVDEFIIDASVKFAVALTIAMRQIVANGSIIRCVILACCVPTINFHLTASYSRLNVVKADSAIKAPFIRYRSSRPCL